MSGYIGTKSVTLSTTTANVGGNSTVGGDLTVDTNTLYVDSTNNRVGVGTASPSNPFQVGTSDLIVDSSGNVGIGTTSPSSYNANIDDLVVSNAASGGITIATGTTSQGAVAFADGTSGSSPVMGRIRYDHSVNEMDFRVNNSEAMRIDSSGNVGIGTSSPDQTLHVHKGSAGTVASQASSVLTLENSTTAVLQFLSPNTASNQIRFGDPQDNGAGYIDYSHSSNALTFGVNGPERMRIDSSGRTLLRTSSVFDNAYTLQVQVIGSTGGIIIQPQTNNYTAVRFNNASGAQVGDIVGGSSSTSYNTTSDHRLKENVTDVTDGITRVKQLEPKRFNFIADPDTTVDGFLAHQAQAVVPEAVTGTHNEVDDDGNAVMQGIDQSKLVPLLTAALKEAITKIETLETEMTSVKARLDALEGN